MSSITGKVHVLPPDAGADEAVDWEALSAAWGTRFPSDYVTFMETYGAGGISDSFEVLRPLPSERHGGDDMAAETANARDQWVPGAAFSGVEGRTGTEAAVIAWGG